LPPDDSGVTEGFATLKEILELAPFTKVVVVTGHGDQCNAVKAVGLGRLRLLSEARRRRHAAAHRAARLSDATLEAENRQLVEALGTSPLDGVIAASESMLKVCRTIEKVAPTNGHDAAARGERYR
jgi:two-component system NtrC family response regulator